MLSPVIIIIINYCIIILLCTLQYILSFELTLFFPVLPTAGLQLAARRDATCAHESK